MEMSEEKIAERIDANVLNIPIKELPDISKKMFTKKVDRLKEKTHGKLIVKEYPTHLHTWDTSDTYYKELNLKKIFNPM